MLPLRLALATCFALFFFAPPALAWPELPPIEWQTHVNEIMADKQNQAAITRFVGKEPDQCLELNTTDQLCEWTLDRDDAGWHPLAQALKRRAHIALICRISTDPNASLKNACSARPRKSNRRMFSPGKVKHELERQRDRSIKRRENELDRNRIMDGAIRAKLRPIAMSWLNSARNLEELSRLLGALPQRCEPAGQGMQNCLWRTSSKTYGHGTVAASIPVAGSKKVDLICTLPIDGSFRQSGESCERRPES